MTPCKIEPVPLTYAILADVLAYDADLILNRMIAIANSRITGLFYGLVERFERLAYACDLPAVDLAASTIGKVAYDIGCMCSDRDLSKAAAAGRLEQTSDGFLHIRDYTPSARYAILSFVEPLVHVALAQSGEDEHVPTSAWGSIAVETISSLGGEVTPVSLDDQVDDYFESHFVAQKNARPETRLFCALDFQVNPYCEAVSHISGDPNAVKEALASFGSAHRSLFDLVRMLVLTCNEQPATETAIFDEALDIAIGPKIATEAFEALYLLFVQPYALIYADHVPLKHYIASRNAALDQGKEDVADLVD